MKGRKIRIALEEIKIEINSKYGFHKGIPSINYGPCGLFAQIFSNKWNMLFKPRVHICFVLTPSKDECYHIVIRLPSGELYDGGVGIHTEDEYLPEFLIKDMVNYDEKLLEKWSYELGRTYPRFCPHFNHLDLENIIADKLEKLYESILQLTVIQN